LCAFQEKIVLDKEATGGEGVSSQRGQGKGKEKETSVAEAEKETTEVFS